MSGNGWLIGLLLLPGVAVAGWFLAARPLRDFLDTLRFDKARLQFRQQREWLEARFLSALARTDPLEAARWDDAHWHNDVRWARDRQTRRLLALIGVEFDANPFEDTVRHATALFEYRKGHWIADGKRVDALRPDEALRRHGRYDPVTPPDTRG
jgi:hypothetical protein